MPVCGQLFFDQISAAEMDWAGRSKMWRIAIGVSLCLVCGFDAAQAQDAEAIAARIASLRVELAGFAALENGAETAEAEAEREKVKLAEADRVLKGAEKRQRDDEPDQKMTFQQHGDAVVKKWEWFKPFVEKYLASGCPLSGKPSDSVRARCGADHEKILAAKPEILADDKGLEDEARALEKNRQDLIDQRNKLTQATLANAAAEKKAEADLADAQAKVQKTTGELQALIAKCKEFVTDEEMKLRCGNVQFDRANPGLGRFHYEGIGTPKMQ